MSRKRNLHISRAVIPSFFTILNMFSGFMSILSSANKDYISAAWLIVLAAIFDSLDGMMARLTKSSSEFGVELDSLSDLVSFGVAPSFMVYQLGLRSLGPLGTLSSAMIMVFGGLRLARFNVQLVGFAKSFFKGLPIPSSAITISSFVLLYYDSSLGMLNETAASFLPVLAVALSLLMVSTVRYDTIPKLSKRGLRAHPLKFLVFLVGLVIAIVTLGKALFWLFLLYIVGGLIRWVIEHIRAIVTPHKREEEEDVELSSFDI